MTEEHEDLYRAIAAKKNLEYMAARPYLKFDEYPSEAALRADVRYVITEILTDEEREQLDDRKRTVYEELFEPTPNCI